MILNIATPNEKQKLFFRATAKHIGFGGARGGGKSWAVRTKAKLLALKYPGIKLLIVRRTYPELINNHIQPLTDELHSIATYNKSEKRFLFSNGSILRFGYCNGDQDLDQYQGAEYDVIFLDEATQLKEMWMKKITACLRGVNDFPKRIYYTMNPGGQGHAYIKRIFIDRRYESGENPEDYVFIQSLITDNTALLKSQSDYLAQLEALPPKLKEAWLYGRWDIFEGQFFEDFRTAPDPARAAEEGCTVEDLRSQRRWTHVIDGFDIPRGWSILRSYDFGYNRPFSCAWWALDYDGVLYRILELYGCTQTPNEGLKWSPDRQFKEIARIEREHPWLKGRSISGVADPAIWDASHGVSIAEEAARNGIYFTPGEHQRLAGWMQCHYRLQFDERGYPRMYVFDQCKGFIRTVPELVYSPTRPEDLDTNGEDHIADEWRYICMSRPVQPIAPENGEPVISPFSDPLNQHSTARRP